MREPRLDYFYGDEARVGNFCRLPRIFVTDEFYRTIPAEIKVLYSLMLDRVAMSMRNNWREDGRVFIYFTLNDAMRIVHVGKRKAIRLFERMETLGLIRRRKQERGKPARIFVREFVEVGYAEEPPVEDAADCAATETESADIPMEIEDIAETPVAVTETNGTPAQIDALDTCCDDASEQAKLPPRSKAPYPGFSASARSASGGWATCSSAAARPNPRLPETKPQDFPFPGVCTSRNRTLIILKRFILNVRTIINLSIGKAQLYTKRGTPDRRERPGKRNIWKTCAD